MWKRTVFVSTYLYSLTSRVCHWQSWVMCGSQGTLQCWGTFAEAPSCPTTNLDCVSNWLVLSLTLSCRLHLILIVSNEACLTLLGLIQGNDSVLNVGHDLSHPHGFFIVFLGHAL